MRKIVPALAVAALLLVGCDPHAVFTARNAVPGVVVSTVAAPVYPNGADAGIELQPASGDEAKITAKTALAECGRPCSKTPSSITLARLGTEFGLAGKLVWIIEYDHSDGCPPHSGPVPPPGQTAAPSAATDCTVYNFVDALAGGWAGSASIG